MRQALLRMDHETLAEFEFTVFQDAGLLDIEIVSCEGPRGVSRIYVEDQPAEHRLDDIDTIQWWERVLDDGDEYVYLVEMNVADRLESMSVDSDEFPRAEQVEVQDEGVSFEQVGSHAELSAVFADLDTAGVDLDLHRLRDYHIRKTPLDALTDRQREVLDTAFELGYYDVPRESSTVDIADELNLDDSTVAEHLQRAEHNLLKTLLG